MVGVYVQGYGIIKTLHIELGVGVWRQTVVIFLRVMNWGQMGVMWKIIKGPGPQYYNKKNEARIYKQRK
jgi:hypothetical protein